MMVNPAAAPRSPRCRVCELVAVPADVTIRLYDPELRPLPLEGAVEYLQAVGLTGTKRQIQAIALTHRHHVDQWVRAGGAVAPAQADGVSRLPPPPSNARWVDVNQQVMNTGLQASELIAERLAVTPDLIEMRDLVAIQAGGHAAAAKRADLEMKGVLRQQQAMARLAAGLDEPED